MKNVFCMLLVISLIVGCSPSPDSIEREATEIQGAVTTATATPTQPVPVIPTQTQIQLSDIDLEEILIVPNDLPAGYSGGQAHEITIEQFTWVSYKGINNLYQEIARDNAQVGGVTVFIYENTNDALKTYQELLDAIGDSYEELKDIGDKGVYSTIDMKISGISVKNVSLVFTRCNASVNLGISGTTDIMGVSAYAKRLDERLSPLVCK